MDGMQTSRVEEYADEVKEALKKAVKAAINSAIVKSIVYGAVNAVLDKGLGLGHIDNNGRLEGIHPNWTSNSQSGNSNNGSIEENWKSPNQFVDITSGGGSSGNNNGGNNPRTQGGNGQSAGAQFVSGHQPWDLNGDGKLQKNEADRWWLNGSGDIWVDNSKINWSGLEIPKNVKVGEIFGIETHQAFIKLPYETAATYGGTSFKVWGNKTVQVLDQKYHYHYRPNNSPKNAIRNILNWAGKPDGNGTDYKIHYYNPFIQIK